MLCPSLGETKTVWCVCPYVLDIVCELLVIGRVTLQPILPLIVKRENPTGGRSWFFTLVGHKVFHVKILVFFTFRIICLLLCQDQSVRSV